MPLVDYYRLLEIDHNMSTEDILKYLRKINRQWTKRNNTCQSDRKEQLDNIAQTLEIIRNAIKQFGNDITRQDYDNELNKAYANGTLNNSTQKEYKDILEQAWAYYYKNDIDTALQYARECVDAQINDPSAYELLADCYMLGDAYDEALKAIDVGLNIFNRNESLMVLGARIATVSGQMYDIAQLRINSILEAFPDEPYGYAEQIYMHLHKGETELAFSEIDSYLNVRPNDMKFRELVAHDLDKYIYENFITMTGDNEILIAEKEAYKNAVRLAAKASEIFNDSRTQTTVNEVTFFGKREWDSWNMPSIKTLTLFGLLLLIIPPVGIAFLLIDILLVIFSFRPYWQINQTWVTGKRGGFETVINRLGYYAAIAARKCWNLLLTDVKLFFRFIFWIVRGGPFAND